MLYKVFIDESGKKEYLNPYTKEFVLNPPLFKDYQEFWRDNYFVLCGIRVKQEDLAVINKKINELKRQYFGTHKIEIKSDWLRNPYQRKKRYIEAFSITPEKLNEFGEKFINLIGEYKEQLKLFAVIFDKRHYGDAKRKTSDGIPLLKTTQVLFERLHYASGYNLVIFDQLESSLKLSVGHHEKVLKVFQKNEGMEKIYVNEYNKITDIKFMESRYENFLQVADVCAYNIYRQFVEFGRDWAGKTKLQDGKAIMNMYPYFNKIRCNFWFNPKTKQVRGAGLVCIPDIDKINWNILKDCFGDKKTSQK